MSTQPTTDTDTEAETETKAEAAGPDAEATGGELEAEVAVLREENRHLREAYRHRLQSNYRRTALGFALLAALAAGGAVLLPPVQDLLLVIAAIAAFAGLLSYYLTPERFVAATVGESVYDSVARTGAALIDDLGLQDTQLYLPTPEGDVQVFVPQHRDYEQPSLADHEGIVVIPDDERARGITLWPTGHGLVAEFEAATRVQPTPDRAPTQLAEALVEQFELVDRATIDSHEPGRITFAISGSAYGGVDRFDHPVGSMLATGLAATLDTPIELDTTTSADSRADYLVTCRWDPDEVDTTTPESTPTAE